MDMRVTIGMSVSLILALGGTLFSVIAYREWRSTSQILKEGTQTQGVVIDNIKKPRRTGDRVSSTAVAPVIRFFTESGQQQTYYSQTYTSPPQYGIGDNVNIWYMPDEPNRVTLKGADAWILPIAFGVFGVVMCLIGYPLAWKYVLDFFR